MKKRILKSYAIGFLVLTFLYLVSMYGAAHQDSILGTIGLVIAGIIGLPIIAFYGADPNPPPSALALIAIGIFEVHVFAAVAFVILSAVGRNR
ncbi:MAG: hypothetical protein ACJ74W_03365 [Pyrinomonadaceae bacterium]